MKNLILAAFAALSLSAAIAPVANAATFPSTTHWPGRRWRLTPPLAAKVLPTKMKQTDEIDLASRAGCPEPSRVRWRPPKPVRAAAEYLHPSA